MALALGTRIGPYEIISAIGAGGMGEVYRARDTKLHRDVALKILPELFATDPDRLARFEREAYMLASLSHPHIATIHGFEDVTAPMGTGAVRALVLELVEGPTIADRIAEGPIPLDEALSIAHQIAEALEAAHEQGIIHRDLKPANIKLRPDGTVKVLDFGLAKALEPASVRADASQSPTITSPAMTRLGVILGTAAYMSPEQAKGRAADKRSDIWAFGCVLFELLTGQRAFGGEDVADTLAFILTKEPDWKLVPPRTPSALRRLLCRCLEKNRKRRLADIADARLDIEEALAQVGEPESLSSSAHARDVARAKATRVWGWTAAGVLAGVALAAAGFVGWRLLQPVAVRPSIRFAVSPPGGGEFAPVPRFLSLSPDGRRLAFITGGMRTEYRLWVRSLDSFTAQPIADTERALNPIWSPDGRSIAFSAGVSVFGGRLRKVDVTGGPALTLADFGVAGAWSHTGVILFRGADGRIYRVHESGGDVTAITDLDAARQEVQHNPEFFLPDGRRFVFQAQDRPGSRSTLYLASLDSRSRTRLLDGSSNVAYANGYLLYQREGTLMIQAFDGEAGRITGPAAPLVEDIDYDAQSGQAAFSASSNGVLAYRSAAGANNSRLTWFSLSGKSRTSVALEGNYRVTRPPRLSPDGRYLAVSRPEGRGRRDLWMIDLDRDVPVRFTFENSADAPVWRPDGRSMVFTSTRDGNLYRRDLHAATTELLYESSHHKRPEAFSPDGEVLFFNQSPQGNSEVWALRMTGERKPIPIVKTGFPAGNVVFSPDGRWFAYCEGDSEADQVYVQPYPPNGTRVRLSSTNGSSPQWSADGKTVVYGTAEKRIMAVDVATSGSMLRVGIPRELFVAPNTFFHRAVLLDSARSRLLLPVTRQEAVAPPINVVINWAEEFKQPVAGR